VQGNLDTNTWFTGDDADREPGALGFDPLKMAKGGTGSDDLKLKEIKNGRLAMCAIGGLIHRSFVTGEPLFPNLLGTPSA